MKNAMYLPPLPPRNPMHQPQVFVLYVWCHIGPNPQREGGPKKWVTNTMGKVLKQWLSTYGPSKGGGGGKRPSGRGLIQESISLSPSRIGSISEKNVLS